MNPLLKLADHGQSLWLDFITRRFITDGKLEKLINEDGLSGVTSNPTIFEKAVVESSDYDNVILRGLDIGKTPEAIFESLAIEDVQMACDVFRPVYEKTAGRDGYVSIEVSPHLARDTQGAQEEVYRLFRGVNRPNVMIKIPATREGLPVIEASLGEGININITLIFSLKRYEEVIEVWLSGLRRAAKHGKPLSSVASVASFFVSRVDALADSLLEKKIAQASGEQKKALESLLGKAAIANAQGAYRIFEKTTASPAFKALEALGARVQRPLWASTSTKNPKYRDVLYVEQLIGKRTVNTMPLATIDRFRDHGVVAETLPADSRETESVMQRLIQAGVDMNQVTDQLEENGIDLFSKSYDQLIGSIQRKRQTLTASSK